MDDRQFDHIFKEKLEAFQDSAPVNPEALTTMMEGLKAVTNPTPWYVLFKPYLVTGLVSIAASVAIFFLVMTNMDPNDPKTKDLVSFNDSIHSNSEEAEDHGFLVEEEKTRNKKIENDSNIDNSQINLKPIQPKNTYSQTKIFNEKEILPSNILTDNSAQKYSLVDSFKWGNPGQDWSPYTMAGVHFELKPQIETPKTIAVTLAGKEESSAEKQSFSPFQRLKIGLNLQAGISRTDIGKARPFRSPGLALQVAISSHIRLATGGNYVPRVYHIDNPHELRPDKLRHFPRLPDPTNNRIAHIRATAHELQIPFKLQYLSGSMDQKVRFLAGMGATGSKVFNQTFTYQKPGGEFFPDGSVKKPSTFSLTAIHGEMGAEIKLSSQTAAQFTLFYDLAMNEQGVEKRKFNTFGIAATFLFGQSKSFTNI